MDSDTPRPRSIGHLDPTVAGRLRLCLQNDGQWWKLFDSNATRKEMEDMLSGLGIFLSPLRHRDFIENNTMEKIVQHLWATVGPRITTIPSNIEVGFKLLTEVIQGRVSTHRSLTLLLVLTPLCATSPSNLKALLDEPADMAVMCGHDDETRMAWLWLKSLLCTLLAFFWPNVSPPSSVWKVDRDTEEVNEMLRRACEMTSRCKWKTVEMKEQGDEDWLKASYQGRYRPNRTRCLWKQKDGETRETCLDEMIAARITDLCPENGFVGLWVDGHPNLVLSANDLRSLFISTDPWESIDRARIPFTKGILVVSDKQLEFHHDALPPARVHRATGIPFELFKGFPCVPKERLLLP